MTDPTHFELDERQRAMLAEMGVPLWWQPRARAAQPVVQEAPVPVPAGADGERRAPEGPRTTPPSGAPLQPVHRGRAVAAAVQAPAITHSQVPAGVDRMDWDALQARVAQCQDCGLCQTRRNTVFGAGQRQARWMVIGDAPGETEDLQGEPFVGQAGLLLDNMLAAISLSRQGEGRAQGMGGVYITNTLKCRPPGNRNPEPHELQACSHFLKRQVALVQPRLILAMGRFSAQSLLQTSEPIGRLRGRVHQYQGVPVVVTYPPDYLLRNQADKAKAWADLCLAVRTVDRP
jgi:uracil-DNA glycosylase family 4